MQLTLKNKDLVTAYQVLDKLSVSKMSANRGRARLMKHLADKLAEYQGDERELLAEYLAVDDDGNYIRDEAGNLKLKDPSKLSELNELLEELASEKVILDSGEYTSRYVAFMGYLADCDVDLTYEQAILMDDLLEQYETQTKETNHE